jgi:hypothetical protein
VTSEDDPLVPDALFAFREANGLRHDDHVSPVWRLPIDFVTILLPNFAWRKRAIASHDLHHLLTGYPCNVAGELQIAAWEFGAGRYPHWGATLFCLPLVLAGALWAPFDTWEAFRAGRGCRSLYADHLIESVRTMRLSQVRAALRR